MKERVQKLMAQADIGSRRACEEIIRQKRVRVNGKVIELGAKADPDVDVIEVDGERINPEDRTKRYIVVNKPQDVLSTNKAPQGDSRPTIRDLIPLEGHWFTIGRLDADSEGLMILTNDGDMTNKLTHPRYEHTKTYKVTITGHITPENLKKWEEGVWLDDSRTASCFVKVIEKNKKTTTLRIVMIEGRKRQIRRIANMFDHHVIRLIRTHIGQLGLGTLKKGAYYELDEEEVAAMLEPAPELQIIRERRRERKRNKRSAAPA